MRLPTSLQRLREFRRRGPHEQQATSGLWAVRYWSERQFSIPLPPIQPPQADIEPRGSDHICKIRSDEYHMHPSHVRNCGHDPGRK
jgi:hypothetical protein